MTSVEAYLRAKKRYEDFAAMLARLPRYDKFGARVTLTETYAGYVGTSETQPWAELAAAVGVQFEKHIPRGRALGREASTH